RRGYLKSTFIMAGRGLTAPLWHTLIGADRGVTWTLEGMDWAIKYANGFEFAAMAGLIGGVAGLITGTATAANTLIEAPYNLLVRPVISAEPERKCYVERLLFDRPRL